MRIFITGGTGLIGSALIEVLLEKGYQITVHSRNVEKARKKFGEKVDYSSSLDEPNLLEGYHAVINLAGESIAGGRWTNRRKRILVNSRLNITHKLSEHIINSDNPPKVFISGSAVGYYGARGSSLITESTIPRNEFTYRLCTQWEASAMKAESHSTRVCLLRTGIVLSSKGGMLPKIALPFKIGLGAVLGTGNQYIPWIHIHDMVNGIVYLLENQNAQGPFNMSSPNPVKNRVFSKSLAKALHRPCLFRVPSFLISLVMGKASTLVLDGQRAVPQKLSDMGYVFSYKNVDDALNNIYGSK